MSFSKPYQLFLAGSLLLICSCTPEACFEETNAFLKASFYINETGKYQAPDSVTLFGEGMEAAPLYVKARNVQPALFPLDASAASCTFIIRINGVTDTIRIVYTSRPALVSKECGYTFYHTVGDISATRNIIDNIIIRNRNITTVNEENIRIFY